MVSSQFTVLLVEDDAVDAMAIRRAFNRANLDVNVELVTDGLQALEKLRGTDETDPLPMPHLILLDINMPRMDGHTFLEELRADPKLRNRVVFVLTTSSLEQDCVRAYERQVAGYFVKGERVPDGVCEIVRRYRELAFFPG